MDRDLKTDALDSDAPRSPAQERVATELRRLDPTLEGLLLEGLRLSPRFAAPGVAYLLAHVGRELSRGVIRTLSEDRVTLGVPREGDDGARDNEKNRTTIAGVLELSPNEAVVTDWHRAHITFADNCHYQRAPARPEEIVEAFDHLGRLLFAVLAPYFEAKPELDRLLTVERPSAADLAGLKVILARRALRQRFFRDVSLPGWIPPLHEWGVLANPPDRQTNEDGSWQALQWVPGQYLLRVANSMPDAVTQIFEEIPSTNTNPSVWGIVARAALVLPLPHVRRLVRLIRRAINRAPHSVFGHDLIRLLVHAAELKIPEAFRLADTVLAIDTSEQGRPRDRWLRHLEAYRIDDVFERVIPSLAAIDSGQTLDLLFKKLRATAQVVDQRTESYPGSSRSWCPHLDRADLHDRFPAKLARSVYEQAKLATIDESSADPVCGLLAAEPHEIFNRILIRLLADVGDRAPAYLDRFLVSDAALEPPFRPSEVAATLRERFSSASELARRLFVYAIERGPGLDDIAWQLRQGRPSEEWDHDIDIAARIAEWQRTRLLWFQDRLPEELRPLADRLGVTPRVLSVQEQALAEDGFCVTSGFGPLRSDVSPRTLDELRAMGTDRLLAFLQEWRAPAPSTPFGANEPNVDGLAGVLTELVFRESAIMERLVEQAATVELNPAYLQAILKGAAKKIGANEPISWPSTLRLASSVLAGARDAVDNLPTIDRATQPWVWAAREALDIVKNATRTNKLSESDSEAAWAVIDAAINVGRRFDGETTIESADDLISAAVNRFSGEAVHALVEVALAGRRLQKDAGGYTPSDQLISLLDEVVATGAAPALAELGRYLPWVFSFAEGWVRRSVIELTDGRDLMNSVACPLWTGYLLGPQFHAPLFSALRGVHRAAAVQADPGAEQKPRRSMTEHLAQHAMLAMLHGLVHGGDEDQLISTTLDRVPVQDRRQSYWLIYRELSDVLNADADVIIPRVLDFWNWRIRCLESLEPTDAVRESEAVGLTWLILASRLPADQALPLAQRTVALSDGKVALDTGLWNRAIEFSTVDPVVTFQFARPIVLAALRSDFADLPVSDVGVVLRAALSSGSTSPRLQ